MTEEAIRAGAAEVIYRPHLYLPALEELAGDRGAGRGRRADEGRPLGAARDKKCVSCEFSYMNFCSRILSTRVLRALFLAPCIPTGC